MVAVHVAWRKKIQRSEVPQRGQVKTVLVEILSPQVGQLNQ